MIWHCSPDTGFEIRTLAVWDRARYLSVTEAPDNNSCMYLCRGFGTWKNIWTSWSEYCFTSLSAQSWQYRDRRKPEAGTTPYSYFEWLQGFFIVHSTIGSTVHFMPLWTSWKCCWSLYLSLIIMHNLKIRSLSPLLPLQSYLIDGLAKLYKTIIYMYWPAPMAHSYRPGLVTWRYQVRIPVEPDIWHRCCA